MTLCRVPFRLAPPVPCRLDYLRYSGPCPRGTVAKSTVRYVHVVVFADSMPRISMELPRLPVAQCYVAHAGDSRCVLCRAGRAVQLTRDHKPGTPSEYARIVVSVLTVDQG